jgi:hypothetical protein
LYDQNLTQVWRQRGIDVWIRFFAIGRQQRLGNFLGNLRTPWTLANDGLQGEGTRAGTAIARFFINTIIGFFGVFDPAKELGFVHHDEDAGDEGKCTPLGVRAPEDVQLTREQHRIQAVEEG